MSRDAGERRPRILDAAERVFLRKGVVAARMEEIAQEAGLSVGGLYWHYKGKRELIVDLLRALFEPDLQDLRALAELPGSTRQRLERCMVRTVQDDQRIRPLVQEVYSLAQRDEELLALLRAYFVAYRTLFAEIINRGVSEGEILASAAESAATSLLALYEGSIELSVFLERAEDPTPRVLEGLGLLLDGLLVAK